MNPCSQRYLENVTVHLEGKLLTVLLLLGPDTLTLFDSLRQLQLCKLRLDQNCLYELLWQQDTVFLGNDYAIKLYSNEATITFYPKDQQQKARLRSLLRSKINQKGFHELFKTGSKIGQGSFASVYKTIQNETAKSFAVKAVSKQDPKQTKAIRLQIEIMRKIGRHPNIVPLHGVFETANSIYLVMDLLEGPTLGDKIQKDPSFFDLHRIRQVMVNIFSGLSHLKKLNIFHRDLKPQNLIFVDNSCESVAIIDFGLADLAHRKRYLHLKCGTPGFVAPEVMLMKSSEDQLDPVCDVFSAGVVMYNLLTHRHLFRGEDEKDILLKNKECEILGELKKLQTKFPSSVTDLLRKSLDPNPVTRISVEGALKSPYLNAFSIYPLSHSAQLLNLKSQISITEHLKSQTSSKIRPKDCSQTTKSSSNSIEKVYRLEKSISKIADPHFKHQRNTAVRNSFQEIYFAGFTNQISTGPQKKKNLDDSNPYSIYYPEQVACKKQARKQHQRATQYHQRPESSFLHANNHMFSSKLVPKTGRKTKLTLTTNKYHSVGLEKCLSEGGLKQKVMRL